MTFEKREDGCWHWEYLGPHAKSSGRILWLTCLLVLLLLNAVFGIVLISAGSSPFVSRVVLRIALFLSLGVALIFLSIWLWGRFRKKECAYTANDRLISPFHTLHTGRNACLRFDQVKTLTQRRDHQAIVLKGMTLPLTVYAQDDDYEAVWRFLKERCSHASAMETNGRPQK